MRTMEEILKDVCSYLNSKGIDYVLIGGIAVIAYGNPRTTVDIDIIIQLEKEDIKEFAEFLKSEGFFSDPHDLKKALHEKSHFTAEMKDTLFRIDLKGVYSKNDRRTMNNRKKIEFEGIPMFIASPEDTIAHKLLYGSEQDINDAEGIYIRQLKRLNISYLKKICKEMNVEEDLDKMQKKLNDVLNEMGEDT